MRRYSTKSLLLILVLTSTLIGCLAQAPDDQEDDAPRWAGRDDDTVEGSGEPPTRNDGPPETDDEDILAGREGSGGVQPEVMVSTSIRTPSIRTKPPVTTTTQRPRPTTRADIVIVEVPSSRPTDEIYEGEDSKEKEKEEQKEENSISLIIIIIVVAVIVILAIVLVICLVLRRSSRQKQQHPDVHYHHPPNQKGQLL